MPTVGLVGSRRIEDELQSKTRQKFVTEFAFPKDSRTPNQISIPHEGANPNKNPEKLGDCYKCDVEDTSMCAPPARFFSSALCTTTYIPYSHNLPIPCSLLTAGSSSSSFR